MQLTVLDALLWSLGLALGALLLLILIRGARYREFPVFSAWMAFVVAKSVLLYVILRFYGSGHLYTRVYWGDLWPEFVIEFGVVFELARTVLRRNGNWIGDAGRLFLFAAIFATVVSALLSVWIVPPRGMYAAWELRGDLFTSLVVCALLVSVSLIANSLRLAWERHALAIAEALTAWSVVSLVVNALESYCSARYFKEIDHFQSYAWIGAMVWIAMDFGLPNPNAEVPAPQSGEKTAVASKSAPPGLLQPLHPGRLLAFQKLSLRIAGNPRRISPVFPAARSVDEVQP